MARPTKLTPDVQDKIVSLLRAGGYVEAAAQAAGISPSTFHDWMARGERTGKADKPYRDFKAAVDQARAEAESMHLALVSRAARDDWRAAAWLLERQHPDRWGKPSDRRAARANDDEPPPADEGPQDPLAFDQLAPRRQARARNA